MLYNKSCFGTLQSALCDQVTAIFSRYCCYIAATYMLLLKKHTTGLNKQQKLGFRASKSQSRA